jgi:hypothetical protein
MRKIFIACFAAAILSSCAKETTPDYQNNSGNSVATHDTRYFGRGGGGTGGGGNFDGIDMGDLMNYLFVFTKASVDANWQGASKGFIGDVVVNGIDAQERTSGTVPYAGVITTNDVDLGAWENIVNHNPGQASAMYSDAAKVASLSTAIESVFTQVNSQTVTAGFESANPHDIDGLNTTNGIGETYVFNMTSGFDVNYTIDITGDSNDYYIFRWDTDANFANGYNGKPKFSGGGGLMPHGNLLPSNFLSVAGDISSSGGGSNPPAPYPQGPRDNNGTGNLITGGTDFHGGGFFTGYWVTTGQPTNGNGTEQPYGPSASQSNGIYVGGWYSKATKFSMTSGTSAVHISP